MTNGIKVTRNVTGSVDGALVRLSQDGEIATVLARATGLLERVPACTLSPSKGRPIKLIRGLCRADVNELIRDDSEFVQDAIVELFGRQTMDEREVKATYHDNDVGFRADDARRGSLLACKSACAWQDADFAIARGILRSYSGTQLFDVAAERLSEREIVAATSSTETDRAMAETLAMILAA
jgi:hypothetical protein